MKIFENLTRSAIGHIGDPVLTLLNTLQLWQLIMPNYSLNRAITDDAYFSCALDGDVTMWLYSTV